MIDKMQNTFFKTLILSGMIILSSCSREKEEIPSNIMPQKKMIEVLSDVHYTEETIQLKNLNYSDSTRKIAYGYYKEVFQKHQITPEQFKESFEWYKSHPEVMNDMYKEIITHLSEEQAKEGN